MNINKIVLLTMCCLPLAGAAQRGFSLRGKVGTLDAPAKAYLTYYDSGKKFEDSTLLTKGSFVFTGRLSAPVRAALLVKKDTSSSAAFVMPNDLEFNLENSDISITTDRLLSSAVVTGSATQDEEAMLNAWRRPYKRVADSITAVYNKMTPVQRADTTWAKGVKALMQNIERGYDSVSRAFIATHLHSYASLRAFRYVELPQSFNPDTAALRYLRFPADMRNSYLGKQLAAIIEKGRQTNAGMMAKDFTENDTSGHPIKMSDFSGKYVLLDFWASWCKPCRAENPNLLKAYQKYKDKNFTILGVSVDDEDGRRLWLKAVKDDGLPWTQVSELKGIQAASAVLYGVTAVPANFLIDPSGKIIARNLRGEALEQVLAERLLK